LVLLAFAHALFSQDEKVRQINAFLFFWSNFRNMLNKKSGQTTAHVLHASFMSTA